MNDTEIGFKILNGTTWNIEVLDDQGNLIYSATVDDSNSTGNECDWLAETNGFPGGSLAPGVADLRVPNLLTLKFTLTSNGDVDGTTFSYFECSRHELDYPQDLETVGFYCPRAGIELGGESNHDLYVVAEGSGIKVIPSPLANVQSDLNVVSDFVIPYEIDALCARIAAFSGSTNPPPSCPPEFDDYRIFVSGQNGGASGPNGAYTPPTKMWRFDSDIVLPDTVSWRWPSTTNVAFSPGDELRLFGTFDFDGVDMTERTAGQGWGGVDIRPGASGSIDDGSITDVNSAQAIAINGTSPRIKGVTISGLASGTDGIRVYGTTPAPQLIDNVVDDIRLDESVTIPSGEEWSLLASSVRAASGKTLTVNGTLNATGTKFTASAPASGWGGLRFQLGSDGTLTDVVIEKVYGWAHYSVWIDNASPSFDNVTINSPVSSLVGGVYVTGSQASPMLHELVIDGMNYGGVTLASQAEARLTDGIVTQSGHGLVAGYLTEGFLYPSLGGARTVGNQFNSNTNEGVRATSYADLYFGYYYYPQSGIHNNGFNSVTNSGSEGVEVTGGGYIAAGNSSNHQRNRFYGNTGDDGYASGSGSSLSALCNWWNDTTPPFRTSTASGGYLNDSFWLSQDPYVNPNAACTDESFRQAGASRAQRLAGAAAMEQPAEALAALSALVTEAPASPEAASALATVGRLAARGNAPQGARGLLQTQAATRGPLRSVARRSLVALHHREGRVTDALAGTEALLADPDSDDDVLFAHVARVHLLSEQGRTAEAQAAYEAIEALAPGSVEARLARDHLGLPYERTVEPRTPESAEAVTSFAVGPVHPNPTASAASVTFALPEEASVRVSVLDVLGREVAVAADGTFDAGRHTASVDVSTLAPGIYLARVAADGKIAVVTRRFTVAR